MGKMSLSWTYYVSRRLTCAFKMFIGDFVGDNILWIKNMLKFINYW